MNIVLLGCVGSVGILIFVAIGSLLYGIWFCLPDAPTFMKVFLGSVLAGFGFLGVGLLVGFLQQELD